MKFNRHIILGRIKYNVFCNEPCYSLCPQGAAYLKSIGWHPDRNPWVDDDVEIHLLTNYCFNCISIPTVESNIDQLNDEFLYGYILQ